MSQHAGQMVGGRYRLERPLATGGMGAIWMARHIELDIEVALKFIDVPEGEDEQTRDRFRREARAAAQLASEHVVRVHDFGFDDGSPHLAMELLKGEDLLDHLDANSPLSPERACNLLRQICAGLKVAHAAGIVHRDIKPSNLFLSRKGSAETLKILDFGVAKTPVPVGGGSSTSVGVLLGSPPYMSPEQARGRAVDPRSDLWSVGAIAFEMLTGRRLFEGKNLTDTVAKICSDPLPVASELAPELPGSIDQFFHIALARRADRRFQSAGELTDAFHAALGQHTTPPGAAPTQPRGRDTETVSVRVEAQAVDDAPRARDSRRRKAPLIVGVLLSGALGIIVLWWFVHTPNTVQSIAGPQQSETVESSTRQENPISQLSATPPPVSASATRRSQRVDAGQPRQPPAKRAPAAARTRNPARVAPPSPAPSKPESDPVFGLPRGR